jgi:hypothetical protein
MLEYFGLDAIVFAGESRRASAARDHEIDRLKSEVLELRNALEQKQADERKQ